MASEKLELPEGPRPDLAAQFQKVLDLLYQRGNNLSEPERKRMETCYVMGAFLSMLTFTTAERHPIDAVGHMMRQQHEKDVADSLERVNSYQKKQHG